MTEAILGHLTLTDAFYAEWLIDVELPKGKICYTAVKHKVLLMSKCSVRESLRAWLYTDTKIK